MLTQGATRWIRRSGLWRRNIPASVRCATLRMRISARSFGFADPDTGIGFTYLMNRLGFRLVDPREPALRNTLFHDILGARPQT